MEATAEIPIKNTMKTAGLAILLAASPVHASEQVKADTWQALVGEWRGEGEVRGMAAAVRLRFEATLDGRGRRLSFENAMTGKDGRSWRFLAEALYLCDAAGACKGQWQDSRGMILPLSTQSQPDRVIVEWGEAATERGRTTYHLADDGSLHMTDEVLGKDGAWKTFGQTRATRVPAEGAAK